MAELERRIAQGRGDEPAGGLGVGVGEFGVGVDQFGRGGQVRGHDLGLLDAQAAQLGFHPARVQVEVDVGRRFGLPRLGRETGRNLAGLTRFAAITIGPSVAGRPAPGNSGGSGTCHRGAAPARGVLVSGSPTP